MSLRAGLSGCGAMGTLAVQQSRLHDHCDIVALHDPDPVALQAMRERTGIALGSTSFSEFLSTGVDFVVLAGPCGVRREQVQQAADQAVPCLLHGPMALDADEAGAIAAIAEAAQMKLGVAVQGQEDPVFDELRRMIAADWFGGIILMQGIWGEDDLITTPRQTNDWRLRPDASGHCPLVRLASHHVHLASWLSGRPALQVTAQATRGFLSLPHDSAVATAVLRGNLLCTFAASHLTSVRAFAIHGMDGGIRIAGDRMWLFGKKPWQGELIDYPDAGQNVMLARTDFGQRLHRRAAELELHGRFARWIDDRDDFPCPAEQAVIDMRVLAAMNRAAVSGRTETV
ncbi:MAG: Gfo/Idh/MocA family oxidoreductase [Planctomycetes bacterium]|nr:Gfo/Idh/MocA family oxidoreductase [Planctomycetota bacterium]